MLFSFAAQSWADGFDGLSPILTHITAGNNECKRDELFGSFDLQTVPQFNALCNIPIPDIHQSDFLLENNVVPVLCMGLMDVSLRSCKSALNDVSKFQDIFPPTAIKFSNIFDSLKNSRDFSSLDEFCFKTVKNFSIKEASSNLTEKWWQLLNKELGDEKHCSDICHSNEINKVHPLCSYILWSNGVYINYQKNKADEQISLSNGEDQKPFVAQAVESAVDREETKSGFVRNEVPSKSTEPATIPNSASLTEKSKKGEVKKSNISADTKNVGEGTVEEIIHSDIADKVKTVENTSADISKPEKIADKPMSKTYKVKEMATTSNPAMNATVRTSNAIQDKLVPSAVQTEVKVPSTVTMVSSVSELQVNAEVAPEVQKPADGQELAKASGGMVEEDVSFEVTPNSLGMDQPIAPDKEVPPPYADEEGEDGDGDDVEMVESSQANPLSNGSDVAAGRTGSVANVQLGPLDGDKVYGEGEVLIEDHFIEAEDSHFFTYFLCMAVLTIMAYLAFHNKKKLIALAVEGRRTKGGRRRPNSSHYSKLDCSLEEALVSNTTASVTHVLY